MYFKQRQRQNIGCNLRETLKLNFGIYLIFVKYCSACWKIFETYFKWSNWICTVKSRNKTIIMRMQRKTSFANQTKSLTSYRPIYRYQNRLSSVADAGVTYSIFFESMILGEGKEKKGNYMCKNVKMNGYNFITNIDSQLLIFLYFRKK